MPNNIHRAMTTPIDNTDTVPNQMENAMHNRDFTSISEAIERSATNRKNTIGRLLRRLEEVSEEVRITPSQWKLIRMAAGLEINPETAEVMWMYESVLADEEDDLGRPFQCYYARNPGSDEWVSFWALPEEIRYALIRKHGI